MSYTSNFNLNQRVSYLESIIQGLIPVLPIDLANVLLQGNSAGASDIDLNNQDILQVNNIDVSTINGGAYPPAPPATPAWSATLQVSNNAGTNNVDLNNNDINNVDNIQLNTINGSAYPPTIPVDTLQDVLDAGNTATGANAKITLTDTDAKLTIVNSSVGGIANPLLVLQNNNTTAGGTTIETYKNDTPTSTGGDVVGIWTASCNTNIGKTEIARISQIAYGVGASNNDGGIILACKVNSSLAPQNFLACNGGAGTGEVQIFRPITNPTGDITISTASSSGTGDILLTPKTTGYVRVSEDILTDSKITTLTNFPASTGSYVDFASNGDDDNFRIDKTSLTFTQNYSAPVDITSSITLLNDATAGTNSIALSQTDTTLPSGSKTTTIVNQQLVQNITMNDTITNKSITLDNGFAINDNRLSFFVDDSSSTYSSTIINNDTIQQLSFSKITGTSGKFLQFNNLSQGEIFFINNLDTNPLVIQSNQDLNINSTKAGGFINMTSASSIDIEATGDNLTLTGGALIQLEATGTGADIIIKPETTAGDLVFEGLNIESGSRGSNSGQNLRIKLNGVYYKIQLYDDI